MAAATVDAYIENSDLWPAEVAALRPILLGAGLDEDIKWRKPCYSHNGKNVAIVQEMNDFLALMFFKGALLEDPEGILRDQGPNSRSARRIEFTSVADVTRLSEAVAAYLQEAMDVEDAGLTVDGPPPLQLAEELRDRLDTDADLRTAFEALTPGRQREYNLYFTAAKKPETRAARVEKYAEKILAGKGMRER